MIRSTARAAAFAVTLALLAPAASAETPKFAGSATTFTLDNGMQVVVIPDHRAPIVTHMVWYKAGAADELPGESGVAHFLEHLMFKGTKDHPEGEFSKVVNSVGGDENAFTSDDVTAYHQTVAKQYLPLMMEFEADRMANLILNDAVVATERDVILEERRMRIDNEPAAQLSEAVRSTLYQNSRYGVPTIGWPDEMAKLDLGAALSWYNRYYTPNNAILIVAGDVTNIPALNMANPGWHLAFDGNPTLAEEGRRKLFDQVVTDKSVLTGYHWGLPGAGTIQKDGKGYALVLVKV